MGPSKGATRTFVRNQLKPTALNGYFHSPFSLNWKRFFNQTIDLGELLSEIF